MQQLELQREHYRILELQRQLRKQIPPGASAEDTHPWLTTVKVPVPANAGPTVPPWTALKLNPVGLYALRRWQGVYPQWDNFFFANQPRFQAADLAWLAAGSHSDGQHLHPISSFHPSQVDLVKATSSAQAKAERKAMLTEMETLVWDLLTALDRLSGSTSLLMRCQGTVVPGAGPAPEYIKNHIYFPPALLAHHPGLGSWLRTVCQQFVENVGVLTVDQWFQRGRSVFGWPLQSRLGNPPPENPVLRTPIEFPSAEPHTSHFVYPGQRRAPATPAAPVTPAAPAAPTTPAAASLSQASTDSYITDELDSCELQIIQLHEQLAFAMLDNRRLTERVANLESGTGLFVNALNIPPPPAPTTPVRRPISSSQARTPIHPVSPSKARSPSPHSYAPTVSYLAHSSGPHVGTSPVSPHVMIRTPRQKAGTPSHHRFNTPLHNHEDEFQPGSSSRNADLDGIDAGLRADLQPDTRSFLQQYLRANGLEGMTGAVEVVERLLPANCGEQNMHHQLSEIGIPRAHIKIVASIIATNKASGNYDS